MLKRLFTSKVRVKLLTTFLLNPDTEFYIRELTRKLDEQINSVRRELDNLKKLGLLSSRMRNRRKFYVINKSFVLFHELKNIITKAEFTHEDLVSEITKLGHIDLLLLSGIFINKENAECDILIVGAVNKDKLSALLEKKTEKLVKFTTLDKDEFIYRIKYNDRFVTSLINDKENVISINKIEEIQ